MDISKLQDLCESAFKLKAEVDELNSKKTEKNKELTKLKAEITKQLEAHQLKKFDSGFGTVIAKERKSVSVEDRNLFFDYLESRGLLRDSFNVTAQTATKIYNEILEQAVLDGDVDIITEGIPGLSEPRIFSDVSINKPRQRKKNEQTNS